MPATIVAASSLAPLLLLACPVGMGLMMWMMMKGGRQQHQAPTSHPTKDEPQLSVEELRAEHSRLTAELDQLEAAERDETPSAPERHR